ncbi:hypothetical protein SOVF_199210 [Spinacia oleracea]|nr:hypothetical protein SOVF_199210 [Spinacia oleracea]
MKTIRDSLFLFLELEQGETLSLVVHVYPEEWTHLFMAGGGGRVSRGENFRDISLILGKLQREN